MTFLSKMLNFHGMNTTIILTIIFVSYIVAMLYCVYLFYRNAQVAKFLTGLNTLCYEWSTRHLHDIVDKKETSAYDWFYDQKVKSYNYYLFSFRPLRLEEWFETPDIEKLLEHNSDEKNNIS